MKASKLLISTAAAIAVVGTIGFAYAQSTDANSTAPITPGQTQAEPVAPTASMPTPPSLQGKPDTTGALPSGAASDMPAVTAPMPTTTPAPIDATPAAVPADTPMATDAVPVERAARADRN